MHRPPRPWCLFVPERRWVRSAAGRLPGTSLQAENESDDRAGDSEQDPSRPYGQLHLTLDHELGQKDQDQAGRRPDDRS